MKKMITIFLFSSMIATPAINCYGSYYDREAAQILAQREAAEKQAKLDAIKADLARRDAENLAALLSVIGYTFYAAGYTMFQTAKFPFVMIFNGDAVKKDLRNGEPGAWVGAIGFSVLTIGVIAAAIASATSSR